MKVAFVGAGFVNFGTLRGPWDHASRLERIEGVEVVAIVDPLTEKASEILEKRKTSQYGHVYKNCKIFPTLANLLSSETKVDAAVVGTPPHTRGAFENGKDVELQLLKSGIHVFCEKPLSTAEPEYFSDYSRIVCETAKQKKLIFSVGYMFRYHAAVQKMKELIRSHGGKVMSMELRYYHAYGDITSTFWWVWDVSKSGGPIVEQATHFCDIARYLAGDVDESSIHTLCLRAEDKGGAGVIDTEHIEKGMEPEKLMPRVTTSHWRFKDGGLGTLVHTMTLKGKKYETSIEVQLNGLRLTLQEPYEPECTLRVRDATSDMESVYSFGDADPYDEELKAFLKAIETNNRSLIQSSYEDATKTYNMTYAIRRAEQRTCQRNE